MYVLAKTTLAYGPQARPSHTRPDPSMLQFTKENPVFSSIDCLPWAVMAPVIIFTSGGNSFAIKLSVQSCPLVKEKKYIRLVWNFAHFLFWVCFTFRKGSFELKEDEGEYIFLFKIQPSDDFPTFSIMCSSSSMRLENKNNVQILKESRFLIESFGAIDCFGFDSIS